jgi:arylsulfatase
MATCIELSGANYPEERNNVPVKKCRGISLVENLIGEKSPEHDAIFWEHEGHGAIRIGKWKLVSEDPKDEKKWELYDMENDRTETNNLSAIYPEKCEEMIEKWTEMAYETKVLPWPDNRNAKNIGIDK